MRFASGQAQMNPVTAAGATHDTAWRTCSVTSPLPTSTDRLTNEAAVALVKNPRALFFYMHMSEAYMAMTGPFTPSEPLKKPAPKPHTYFMTARGAMHVPSQS